MPFAIGKQRQATGMHRPAQAYCGQGVLQHATRAPVHMHIAGSHQGQAAVLRQPPQQGQLGTVVSPAQQLDGNPGPTRHACLQRLRLGLGLCLRRGLGLYQLRGGRLGAEQGQATGQAIIQVGPVQRIAALAAASPTGGDQPGKAGIAGAVGGQQHQFGWCHGAIRHAVLQQHFAANEQWQPGRLGCDMRSHHTGERTLIGDGQCGIAQFERPLHQFFRMRSATQKTEIRQTVQLGIGRQSGIHGCCLKRNALIRLVRLP